MQNNINLNNLYYKPKSMEENMAAVGLAGDNSPVTNESLANEIINMNQVQQPQPVLKDLYQPSWNIKDNAVSDIRRIGTGLVHFFNNPIETSKGIGKAIGTSLSDYYANMAYNTPIWERPIKGAVDAINLLNPLDIKYGDVKDVIRGRQSVGDVAARALLEAYTHPVDTALNFWALKGLGGAGTKATTKSVSRIAEDAINLTNQKVRSKGFKVLDQSKEFNRFSDAAKAGAIEAFETGKAVTDKETKQALKSLRKYSDEYDNLVREMSPDTYVPGNIISTNQKLVRDGIVANYADAEKATARIFNDERIFSKGTKKDYGEIGISQGLAELEGKAPVKPLVNVSEKTRVLTKDGKKILEGMAKDGDDIAGKVLESQELYNKGWLRPVTHGLAEVDKSLQTLDVLESIAKRTAGAGKFTERTFGNASYQDIANQLSKPSEWLDSQMTRMVEGQLSSELANTGTIGGVNVVADATEKGVKFVSKDALEKGSLSAALETASDTAVNATDIPISKAMIDTLKTQMRSVRGTNPFDKAHPVLRDLYTIGKSNALASGKYLVGNAQTGLYNMFLNEGLNPVNIVKDLGAAWATKGKLAKEMGIFRDAARSVPKAQTPLLRQVQRINAPVANTMQYLDAKMQNLFAETAAHANLRRMGISTKDRIAALENMDAAKLADIIKDTKNVSLINPTKTILPGSLHGVAGLTNPFWRWIDTAAQSTAYMFEKHPLLSYYVMVDGLAKIGYDRELQNRYNLGVTSDKPFVTFRNNPRTGKIQETSMEFSPMMNTLKVTDAVLSGNFTDVFGQTIPAFSAIANSFVGKDRYGNPIKRPEMSATSLKDIITIQNGKRFKWETGKGFVQEVGWMPDETIAAIGRELFAYPNLINMTLMPTFAGLTGQTYYKPYASSLLGTINRAGYGDVPLQAGNPRTGASTLELQDLIKGAYSTDYYPEREYTTKAQSRRAIRGAIRRSIIDRSYTK